MRCISFLMVLLFFPSAGDEIILMDCISRADLNRSNRWKHRVAEKKERF